MADAIQSGTKIMTVFISLWERSFTPRQRYKRRKEQEWSIVSIPEELKYSDEEYRWLV